MKLQGLWNNFRDSYRALKTREGKLYVLIIVVPFYVFWAVLCYLEYVGFPEHIILSVSFVGLVTWAMGELFFFRYTKYGREILSKLDMEVK